jgi:hypothetical protein
VQLALLAGDLELVAGEKLRAREVVRAAAPRDEHETEAERCLVDQAHAADGGRRPLREMPVTVALFVLGRVG